MVFIGQQVVGVCSCGVVYYFDVYVVVQECGEKVGWWEVLLFVGVQQYEFWLQIEEWCGQIWCEGGGVYGWLLFDYVIWCKQEVCFDVVVDYGDVVGGGVVYEQKCIWVVE